MHVKPNAEKTHTNYMQIYTNTQPPHMYTLWPCIADLPVNFHLGSIADMMYSFRQSILMHDF